jgi:penicillin amidase
MRFRILIGTLGAALAAAACYLAARPIRSLPPLGPLLDPAHGIWAVPRAARPLGNRIITAPFLDDQVEVVVDRRGVPHLYAATELDAYRVLGYLVARDRLFQLELQTRAAAGTLTELVGPGALAADRRARRLGFGRLVEGRLAAADSASPAFRAIVAYAEGVNRWIESMRPGDLPIEYRLLGRQPAKWSSANTYYLLARMALTLAYNDPSLLKARAAALVGRQAADALFPAVAPIQEPIQPNPIDSTRYQLAPIPPPGPPDLEAATLVAGLGAGEPLGSDPAGFLADAVGSNNWAVAPSRSASGHALLAGDPHLELTLPSIWYQAHLVVPDRLDVAGVTLPGAPWVVIGFNRDIAWSFTNTGSDVNDFYRETVDDSAAPTRYRLDGAWRPLAVRVETFLGSKGDTLAVDTVRYTHRGPLEKAESSWISMAWTIYQPDGGGSELLAMGRAGSVAEFLRVSAGYAYPAQNMIVADRAGAIAIRSTGRYPLRPDSARGDWIQDGSRSSADWTGTLAVERYPAAINPPRGFLSSANQQPVDPAINPVYLGANWPSPWRAMRINAVLRADSQVTVDAMRRYQTDPLSARAVAFVPLLLGAGGDSARLAAAAENVRLARARLAGWDRRYTLTTTEAVLFDAVMAELARRTWDELAPTEPAANAGRTPPPRPSEMVLLALLQDPVNPWWDDRRSSGTIEGRDDIVEAALAAGFDSTVARHGAPGPSWEWGRVHRANIHHLLGIEAFSALGLPVSSGPSTVSPSSGSGTHGASWRMVVDLGQPVVGYGTYPGGQSGNPMSPHYRDFLDTWLGGRLDSLIVPASPAGFDSTQVESRLRFRKGS